MNSIPVYKSYKYKDKIFHQIKQLRKFVNSTNQTNYSETHFKRLFLNINSPRRREVEFIGQKTQSDVFSIDGNIFYGWVEIVNAGLAQTKSQVFYRLNSTKYNTWVRVKQTKTRKGKTK